MCVLSECQHSVEINKITLVKFKFISSHKGALALEMTSNASFGLFRHVMIQKYTLFLH